MAGRRFRFHWLIFLALLVASIALTALLWPWGLFLFLFLPFSFFSWGSREAASANERVCPRCGWSSQDTGDRFCPRDSQELVPPSR